MKLGTFEIKTDLGTCQRTGCNYKDGIVDLHAAYKDMVREKGEPRPDARAKFFIPTSMLEFISGGETVLAAAKETMAYLAKQKSSLETARGKDGARFFYPLSEVRLKAPLPSVPQLRDFQAFDEHARRAYERRGKTIPQEWYKRPIYYKGNPLSIIGPDEDVMWPSFTEKFDYELEIAMVIGKEGRNIPANKADDYIFGYTILNDFSARDIQMEEMALRLGPAKGKDFGSAIGPWIVTKDEIGNPHNLKMMARINGEVWSQGNSGTSYWKFGQIIAHASLDETLYPCEIIGTGTVGGGCGLELDRWLKPGDTVELEIEKIGILKNKIVRRPS